MGYELTGLNAACCCGAPLNHFSAQAGLKRSMLSLMDYTREGSCPHLPFLKAFSIRSDTALNHKQHRSCQFVMFSMSLPPPSR